MRSYTIRTHILLLVFAVSAPLAAFVAYGIYSDMSKSVRHSKENLRMVANTMAINTGIEINNAKKILEKLAAKPSVRRLDPDNCDEILDDVIYLNSSYANIGYTDIKGTVICTVVPSPNNKPVELGKTLWFQKFLKNRSFTLGEPFMEPFTGKMATVLTMPIWNERHELIGAVTLPLNLSTYDPKISVR